jgi:hypothetical protein
VELISFELPELKGRFRAKGAQPDFSSMQIKASNQTTSSNFK